MAGPEREAYWHACTRQLAAAPLDLGAKAYIAERVSSLAS